MTDSDAKIRRILLKPLIRRTAAPADRRKLQAAFEDLEEQAIAASLLPQMAREQKERLAQGRKAFRKDPDYAERMVELALVLYVSRRMSLQQYVFTTAMAVESVHDEKLFEGQYPEIEVLSEQIRAIELAHGLQPDEYWPRGQGPADYLELQTQWEQAAHLRLCSAMEELEGGVAAKMLQNDREGFEKIRERGRRAAFHKAETTSALVDTVIRYEDEARLAAGAGAYTAAVVLMGSALEGLLLLRCLQSKIKALRTAKTMAGARRPRHPNEPMRWTLDNLIEVCLQAGWLPIISKGALKIRPDGLAHMLRGMRNHIHPGKVCTDRPWVESEQRDYEDAEVIYTTLFTAVLRGSVLKRYLLATGQEGN